MEADLTLRVPRAIPALLAALGITWAAPTVVGFASGAVVHTVFAPVTLLIALALIGLAVRLGAVRTTADQDGLDVRARFSTERVAWADVKGLALLQDGGFPVLRIVRRDADTLVVPAWSLRAVHADGESEPAGPALERLGEVRGVKVVVRGLTGPVRSA